MPTKSGGRLTAAWAQCQTHLQYSPSHRRSHHSFANDLVCHLTWHLALKIAVGSCVWSVWDMGNESEVGAMKAFAWAAVVGRLRDSILKAGRWVVKERNGLM